MSDPPGTKWFKQQTQQIQNQGPAAEIPYGPVQGELNLLPQYNDLGPTRPFGQGEYLKMPNGAITSEETYTAGPIEGKYHVIPGLWLKNGVPHHVTEDEAVELMEQSGLDWPHSYDTLEEADKYSVDREQHWQDHPGQTKSQESLWKRR
jgi:hypothetical protein